MTKEVSAAIGTQRQFAKQPEMPYELKLNPLNVSNGIHQRADYDAQRLATALGVLPKAIGEAKVAIDKRQQENAKTLVNAEKILSGKTKEDLQMFDRMSALQHVDGYNLSHNKYAMAILEQNIGKMASTYAKQQWADMPEAQRPKSVDESVKLYQQLLQDNYKTFGENIQNRQAFDNGYYNGAISDTMKVANEADQRINDEAHYKMMMSSNVTIQDLIYSGATGEDFVSQATPLIKQVELASRDIKDFAKAMQGNLAVIADKDIDGSRLKALESMSAFGGTPLNQLISFAPYKKQIAQNCRKEIGRQAYEKYKLPNGGFNWKAYQEDKKNRPSGMFNNSIPNIDIPISEGDNPNLENLTPAMKGVVSKLGGILFNKGFGDVMQLTSGWRSVEHNAEVGGVEGSKHTTGDALDVYIGDPSQEQIEDIKSTLSPYFGYVTVHDAGTGTHLHVQEYKGGLESNEDTEDLSYGAYDPDRDEAIDKQVRALMNKDKQLYQDQQRELKTTTANNMFKAADLDAAYNIIESSSLSPDKKQQLKASADRIFKARRDAKAGILPKLQTQMVSYTDPFSANNVYKDQELAKAYQDDLKAMENGDYSPTTQQWNEKQMKYNAAARRLEKYWSYLYVMSNGQYGISPDGKTVDLTKGDPDLPGDIGGSFDSPVQNKEAIEQAIANIEAHNGTPEDIKSALTKYAKDHNFNIDDVLAFYKPKDTTTNINEVID